MDFDRVIEELIRKAQEEGKFRDLRGRGKPLNLDENAFEDPAMRMANHMLKEHGFRPDWLEDDVSLRQELEQARRDLARTRDWRAAELARLAGQTGAAAIRQRELVADEWSLARQRFRQRLEAVNKVIFTLNLKVPSTQLQRRKLDVEAELEKVLRPTDEVDRNA
jgi:hypothetical protein